MVYATGGGQTTPESEDGRIAQDIAPQLQNVSARIGGVDAEVLYAGAAPGSVSGVLQVNIRLPASVLGVQPVQITIGTAISQPGVSVAIVGE